MEVVVRSLVLGLLLLAGCGKRPPPPNGYAVKKITFEGNTPTNQSAYSLRGAMEQGQNERFTWLAPRRRRVYLDADQLRLDAWRLETWYAHRGYFDARFLGWDVVVVRPRRGLLGRPPTVRIYGRLDEGAPSMLGVPEGRPGEAVELLGFEDLPMGGSALVSSLRNSIGMSEGEQFNLSAIDSAEQQILTTLQERSFARATVRTEVTVWAPEHLAQVKLIADTGPDCTIGDITFVGRYDIPEEFILNELAFDEGDPYRASKLAETQQRLFSLGVFSVVNVVPVLDQSEGSEIPVHIFLTERQPQQIKVGGGFLVESGKQDVHTSATYSHANVGNRLVRFEGVGSLGYTVIGNVDLSGVADEFDEAIGGDGDEEAFEVTDQGFIYGVETNVTVPRPLGLRGTELTLSASVEKIIEPSYEYISPQISPGVNWRLPAPLSSLSLTGSYGLSVFIFQNLEEGATLDSSLPQDLENDRYVLSELRQAITYDTRKDPFSPDSGAYGLYEVTEAGGVLGGQYSFLRLEADHRRYLGFSEIGDLRLGGRSERGRRRTLRERFGWYPKGVLALRLGGGAIFFPYGDPSEQLAPLPERLYLGGASDVRGWARQRLGPYVCNNALDTTRLGGNQGLLDQINQQRISGYDCSSLDGYASAADAVTPIGGRYSAFASAEFRRYFWEYYGVAVFTDLGMVFLDEDDLVSSWQQFVQAFPDTSAPGDRFLAQTVGAGFRYKTPVGAVPPRRRLPARQRPPVPHRAGAALPHRPRRGVLTHGPPPRQVRAPPPRHAGRGRRRGPRPRPGGRAGLDQHRRRERVAARRRPRPGRALPA